MSRRKASTKNKRPKKAQKKRIKLFPVSRIVEISLYSFFMFWLGVLVERGWVTFNIGHPQKDILKSLEHRETYESRDNVDVEFYKKLSGDKHYEIDPGLLSGTSHINEKSPKFNDPKKQYVPKFSDEVVGKTKDFSVFNQDHNYGNKTIITENYIYTVQIAAFKDISDARKLVQQLKKKTFVAYLTSAVSDDGKLWYRVRTEKFASRDQAEKVRLDLFGKTNINGIILKINKQE